MNTILVFGDSISAGKGLESEKTWASKLGHQFLLRNGGQIYNLSMAGESTTELLGRFETECKVQSRNRSRDEHFIIIFSIGINDSKGIDMPDNPKTSIGTFTRNILKLIDVAKHYSDAIIFVGLTPVDEKKTAPFDNQYYFLNRIIKNYHDVIKDICAKRNIVFVDIFNNWINKDYNKFLLDDGIHTNEPGHEKILESIASLATIKNESLDSFSALKRTFSLTDADISRIKSRFIESNISQSKLFIGQFSSEKPSVIIGAPCIRKDVDGISLNTFYQIFMPLKIASVLKIPCKIFIGTKEEIMFQPNLVDEYLTLGMRLIKAIKRMGGELHVVADVVETSTPTYDFLISESINESNIRLSAEESTYLFNLSARRTPKLLHSNLRTLSSARVVACNTFYGLKKLFGQNIFLIVEDAEQHVCTLFAQKFNQSKSLNFLAFLPLPNIHGTESMFKSEKEGRLILNQTEDYYQSVWSKSPRWVLEIYQEVFRLVKGNEETSENKTKSPFEIIQKISRYFV